MAAINWTVTLSYGAGGNYDIVVVAPSQSKARQVAEHQTGDKAIRATR